MGSTPMPFAFVMYSLPYAAWEYSYEENIETMGHGAEGAEIFFFSYSGIVEAIEAKKI